MKPFWKYYKQRSHLKTFIKFTKTGNVWSWDGKQWGKIKSQYTNSVGPERLYGQDTLDKVIAFCEKHDYGYKIITREEAFLEGI